jgi:hypothetical protein
MMEVMMMMMMCSRMTSSDDDGPVGGKLTVHISKALQSEPD